MNRAGAVWAASLLLVLTLASCGGGGSSSSSFTSSNNNNTPVVVPLVVTNTSLPNGVSGKPYSAQLQASGGTPPYTWTPATGFPSWLTLDSKTGALSGTIPANVPAWSGSTYAVNFSVSDSAVTPQTIQKSLQFFAAGQITIVGNTNLGTRGVHYLWQAPVYGGQSPYTVTVDSGLPAGLLFTLEGTWVQVTGTPAEAGTFNVQFHVADSANPKQDVTQTVPLTIDTKFTITSTSLRAGVVGRVYSDKLVAVNGLEPLTWSANVSMPAGLTLNATTGDISGTPVTAQYNYIYFTVKDANRLTQTASYYIPLNIAPEFAFVSPVLQANANAYVNQSLHNGGGVSPLTVTLTSGSLPPGLTFGSGSIYGKVTTPGTFAFTVQAIDSDSPPRTFQQDFTFTVLPPLPVIGTGLLPAGAVNSPYSAQLYAREGTLPYHWSVTDGQLPSGLTMQDSGNIAGTPTAAGNFSFTAGVTDSASPPQTGTRQYTIAIAAAARGRNDSIATASPLGAGGGEASLSPFADPPDSATSAPDTDFYRLLANADSTVTLSIGSSNKIDPVMEILDANGQRYKTCRDVGDDNPTLTFIVKDTTPAAFDDECVNDDVDPTNDLSSRLEFKVPGAAGTQVTFYLHVFDSSGRARPDMRYYINASGLLSPLAFNTSSLPDAFVGGSYYASIPVGGGTWPVSLALAPGSAPLPPGLTISTPQYGYGGISGTPTSKGTYSFTLQLSDSSNPVQVATRIFVINVK